MEEMSLLSMRQVVFLICFEMAASESESHSSSATWTRRSVSTSAEESLIAIFMTISLAMSKLSVTNEYLSVSAVSGRNS